MRCQRTWSTLWTGQGETRRFLCHCHQGTQTFVAARHAGGSQDRSSSLSPTCTRQSARHIQSNSHRMRTSRIQRSTDRSSVQMARWIASQRDPADRVQQGSLSEHALMKYYAGIGSRRTPIIFLKKMQWLASELASHGYVLRSGHAVGADRAFESGCSAVEGSMEIFTAYSPIPAWAMATVEQFHPAPHKLGEFARKLHARNAMILLGPNGDSKVEFVVCYTPSGQIEGGTGQGIRIAAHHKIPIYNIQNQSDRELIGNMIRRLRDAARESRLRGEVGTREAQQRRAKEENAKG